MEATSPSGPARSSATRWTALCCASFVLSAALAAWLLSPDRTSPFPAAESIRYPYAKPTHVATGNSVPVAAAAATNAPPFRWTEIESADYRQYVANLRAVGCPEQIIHDILAADLNQLYAPRTQAIWKPPRREYWQKPDRQTPNPDELKQLMALDKEKSGLFQELLGAPLKQQGLIDTLYLQVHGSEYQLLFLPADRREAALQALNDAGFDQRESAFTISHPNEDPDQSLFDEKLKILENVLSSEQLDEFRLRNSRTATTLRTELQYFDCTPEEFKALLELREQNAKGRTYGPDLLNRAAATAEVRTLFGDERAE